MAGIDAPSTDLTQRIQARRKAMVLSGDLEPMKPGERQIHGRSPGASLDVEALGRAQDARSRRSERVVEMDYEDYTGTQPASREAADADEPFEVGAEEQTEPDTFDLGDEPEIPLGKVDIEVVRREPGPLDLDTLLQDNEDLALLFATQSEKALDALAGLNERFDELGRGFVAFAENVAEALAKLDGQPTAAADPTPPAPVQTLTEILSERPVAPARIPWYRRKF